MKTILVFILLHFSPCYPSQFKNETSEKKVLTRQTKKIQNCNYIAEIEAFSKIIYICLRKKYFEDDDIIKRAYKDIPVYVYGNKNKKSKLSLARLKLGYVDGYVLGEEMSSVSGYLVNSTFFGYLIVQNQIIFIDPVKVTTSLFNITQNSSGRTKTRNSRTRRSQGSKTNSGIQTGSDNSTVPESANGHKNSTDSENITTNPAKTISSKNATDYKNTSKDFKDSEDITKNPASPENVIESKNVKSFEKMLPEQITSAGKTNNVTKLENSIGANMSKSENGSGNNVSSINNIIPSFQNAARIKKDNSSINPTKKLSENHVTGSENITNVVKSQEKSSGNTTGSKKINISGTTEKFAKPNQKKCSLSLIADDLFFQEVGNGSLRNTIMIMLYYVKEANTIFQTKDFDNDGKSDCVGFEVSSITIFESETSSSNILTKNYPSPEDFLRKFSRYNFNKYCLGLLFTSRVFEDLVLGLSWRGNPKPEGVGGICQQRTRYNEDNKTYSFNSLFVTFKSKQQSRIPIRMAVLNLVHEFMHGFGAKHDSDGPPCTPTDYLQNGRFMMSKYSNNGRKQNHQTLSSCSQESVKNVLNAEHRTKCLKEYSDTFCGNGILEEGEECDCGDNFQCLLSGSTCNTPSGGAGNPCSFRK